MDVSAHVKGLLKMLTKSEDKTIEMFLQFDEINQCDIYINILTNLRNALKTNNVVDFKRLCKLVALITDVSNPARLKNFFNANNNPFKLSNIIILICKHNKVEFLRYIFGKACTIISNLSIQVGNAFLLPTDKDEDGHNAFYYAVRSGNQQLIGVLMKNWPEDNFSLRPVELCCLLSKSFNELKLKNVDVSKEMQFFIHSILVDNYLTNKDCHNTLLSYSHKDINERISLILECYDLLKVETKGYECESQIAFLSKIIARNIFILKKWLKSTYDRIPWEEMEYHLITHIRFLDHEINYSNCFVTRSDFITYLGYFSDCLVNETKHINEISVNELCKLPPKKRDDAVKGIIQKYPFLEEFYQNYELIRNNESLNIIKKYVDIAVQGDAKEKSGKTVIVRALQVMGENLKNTFESPKLSSVTSDYLMSFLPCDTLKILTSLRNSFSHGFPLWRCKKIEEIYGPEFYEFVQMDLKNLNRCITLVLHNLKIKSIRSLMKKVWCCEDLERLREMFHMLRTSKLYDFLPSTMPMNEDIIELEKIIADLNNMIEKKTHFEQILFSKINDIINTEKDNLKNSSIKYKKYISLLFSLQLTDFTMDDYYISIMKKIIKNVLDCLGSEKKSPKLREIGYLATDILKTVHLRVNEQDLFKLLCLIPKICYLSENQEHGVHYLLELMNSFKNAHPRIIPQEELSSSSQKQEYLLNDLALLENIMKHNLSKNNLDAFMMFKNKSNVQAEVEMLILSILSTLETMKHPMVKNPVSFDEDYPLLVGKNLRNHIAHSNALVEILLDPTESIYLFAIKITKQAIATFTSYGKSNSLCEICQNKLDARSQLNNMLCLKTQNNLFVAISEGDLEKVSYWIKQGADVYGRDCNMMTSLHFAARSPNIGSIKFLIDYGLNPHVTDSNQRNLLHISAASGQIEIVNYIIQKFGLKVDEVCKHNKTPLHIAAENDCVEVVKTLLESKAKTNVRDILFMKPLYRAVQSNSLKVVKFFLKSVKNVDSERQTDGFTLLHVASEKGFLELVDYLISKGADVNALTERQATPLHLSSFFGHLEVVKALILKGASKNAKSVSGLTPLHNAVEKGHYSVVEFLLINGADVNVLNDDGHSLLHYAIGEGYADILKLLLKYGASTKPILECGTTLLEYSILNDGNLDVVKFLVECGASINVKNADGNTLLHLSIMKCSTNISEWLIQHGADINARDKHGVAPLQLAIQLSNFEAVNQLFVAKADIFTTDKNNQSLLHICATASTKAYISLANKIDIDLSIVDNINQKFVPDSEMFKIFEELVKKGVNFEKKNSLGHTPLHLACLAGNTEIVRYLVGKSINISSPDDMGFTPLHYAVDGNHIASVKMLLAKKNCCINSTTLNGDTALCLASKQNYIEICRLLIKNEADVNIGNPLYKAVQNGYQEICEILLHVDGIDVKKQFQDHGDSLLQIASAKGLKRVVSVFLANKTLSETVLPKEIEKSLQRAVMFGHDKILLTLLDHGADVNISFNEDLTPAHLAALYGHSNIIEILLNRGADFNKVDKKKRKPLELAVAHNHLEVVKTFFRGGKNIDIDAPGDNGFTLLHIAAQLGHLDLVKFLVNEGAATNVINTSGSKPIHIAARDGHLHVVQYFLDCIKMNITEVGCENMTLLHYAAQEGQFEVVKYLIEKKINVNEPDKHERRPIHLACSGGFEEVLKLLLENGAFYNCADASGLTPMNSALKDNIKSYLSLIKDLFHSVKKNDISNVKSLVEKGACVNAKDFSNATSLHYAAWKGFVEIAKILIENKGNPNLTGKDGYSPLHYASKFNNYEVAKMLLENGAMYNLLSSQGKTPLQLAQNKDIIILLRLIENSFKNVQNCDCKVLEDLEKFCNSNVLKAVLNARNVDDKTLMTCAVCNDFPHIKKLKNIFFKENDVNDMICSHLAATERYDEALNMRKELLQKKKQVLGLENPATLETEENVAIILYKQQKYNEAFDIAQKIFEKRKALFGMNNKYTLKTRSFMGTILHRLGRDIEAIEIIENVYKILNEISEPDDENLLSTLSDMALVLNGLRRHDEALTANQKVYERRLKKYGPSHYTTLVSQNNIGQTLSNLKKYDDAIATYKCVYELRKKVIGPLHSDTLRTQYNLNAVLCLVNKSDEALQNLQELLKLQEKKLGLKHIDTLNTECAIGKLLFQNGNFIQAFKILKENVQKQRAVLGNNHPSVQTTEKLVAAMKYRFDLEGPDGLSLLNQINSNSEQPSKNSLFEDPSMFKTIDSEGRSLLHFAVSESNISIIKELLLRGCDVMHVTNKGNTALHIASSKGNAEIAEMLLNTVKANNPDRINEFVNAKTKSGGNSALHAAANVEIAKVLLKYGAIYNIKNKIGKNPKNQTSVTAVSDFLELISEFFSGALTGDSGILDKLKLLNATEKLAILNARNEQNHTLLQVSLANKNKKLPEGLSLIIKML